MDWPVGSRWLMPVFGSRRHGVRYVVLAADDDAVYLESERDGHELRLTRAEAADWLEPLDGKTP